MTILFGVLIDACVRVPVLALLVEVGNVISAAVDTVIVTLAMVRCPVSESNCCMVTRASLSTSEYRLYELRRGIFFTVWLDCR